MLKKIIKLGLSVSLAIGLGVGVGLLFSNITDNKSVVSANGDEEIVEPRVVSTLTIEDAVEKLPYGKQVKLLKSLNFAHDSFASVREIQHDNVDILEVIYFGKKGEVVALTTVNSKLELVIPDEMKDKLIEKNLTLPNGKEILYMSVDGDHSVIWQDNGIGYSISANTEALSHYKKSGTSEQEIVLYLAQQLN